MKSNLATARLIYDRRKKVKKENDLGTVELEVTYGRERRRFTTGVHVCMREWDDGRKRVIRHGDLVVLNEKLSLILSRAEGMFAECLRRGEAFEWWMLEGVLEGRKEDDIISNGECGKWLDCSFVEWIIERISGRKDLRESTLNTHRSFVELLKTYNDYCWSKGNAKMCVEKFRHLKKANIMSWDGWLHLRGYKQTTVYGYHKRMKRYINEAMMMEMVEKNPYDLVKINRGKASGVKYLTKVELLKLERAKCCGMAGIEEARDLFVFQAYTGMAYADMSKFDWKLCEKRQGKIWYRGWRQKTDEEYRLLLLPQAVKILKKYDYVLPTLTNQAYNLRLKSVGVIAGLNKDLTSHMARHTFAVMCLNSGMEIETLAKIMGHNNIATTQIYAKVLGKTVETAMIRLQEKL